MQSTIKFALLVILAGLLSACANPGTPSSDNSVQDEPGLRVAVLDYQIGDLTDPAVIAKYSEADILITLCENYWGDEAWAGQLDMLRVAYPDLKIIGYFRSKVVRTEWGDLSPDRDFYRRDLYEAAKPYWCQTTTGDTLFDWPNAVVYDYTQPAVRKEMIAVFKKYQETSGNRFDGVFWDYFSPRLWIAPIVQNMDGEPDMDGDGVPHWNDEDELASFLAGQEAFIREMQDAMGPDFIQIANGNRAPRDSVFAGSLDGIFYELFPAAVFGSDAKFAEALSPDRYNNLFTARSWPRTTNGGPWLILSHAKKIGSFESEEGAWEEAYSGDFNRVMALLTDATSIHYDNTGAFRVGVARVSLSLGLPLSGVTIDGNSYSRDFEFGRVEMEMGTGAYPAPFNYRIIEHSEIIESVAVAN